MNQTCIEPRLPCNCDAKLPDWQVDEGVITDKDLLPITEFAYGPLEYDLEEAKVSIGSLKCSGSTIGSTSQHFGPTPSPVLPPPEILRNDCGLAELVTDNRLKINLRYSNGMNCYVTLKLPETKTMKLTIDDFLVSLIYFLFILMPHLIISLCFSLKVTMTSSMSLMEPMNPGLG